MICASRLCASHCLDEQWYCGLWIRTTRCPTQGSSTLHGTDVHIVLSMASQKPPSNSEDHGQARAISIESGRPLAARLQQLAS